MAGTIQETRFEGVFSDSERLYTRNLSPGTKVYGERLLIQDGIEYREWVPTRSKLAAYIKLGGSFFPFKKKSRVLYLGAASGTTSSHISDIVSEGTVYCVEISQRSFRDLVTVCETRPNMVPILADATKPEGYRFVVERAEVVYQDIAQKGQARILAKNMRSFAAIQGMLALKARSEDVTRPPSEVIEEAKMSLRTDEFRVVDSRSLDPLEKDHGMIGVEWG